MNPLSLWIVLACGILFGFGLSVSTMIRPEVVLDFLLFRDLGLLLVLGGAAIFGTGWGLCGVCPGPAIAGLGVGNWPAACRLGRHFHRCLRAGALVFRLNLLH
jgi:uncharacterized membrane protein YedE/YeeE